jgi:hypothetical protein
MRRDDGVEVRMTASPLRLSVTPPRADLAPPALGAHTDEVLATLGYSEADISGLRARGIV